MCMHYKSLDVEVEGVMHVEGILTPVSILRAF